MITFIYVLIMIVVAIAVWLGKSNKTVSRLIKHSSRWYPPHRYLFLPFYRNMRSRFPEQRQALAAVMLFSGVVHAAVILPMLVVFPGKLDYLIILSLLFYPAAATRIWFFGKGNCSTAK